jgi:hypothetical protein
LTPQQIRRKEAILRQLVGPNATISIQVVPTRNFLQTLHITVTAASSDLDAIVALLRAALSRSDFFQQFDPSLPLIVSVDGVPTQTLPILGTSGFCQSQLASFCNPQFGDDACCSEQMRCARHAVSASCRGDDNISVEFKCVQKVTCALSGAEAAILSAAQLSCTSRGVVCRELEGSCHVVVVPNLVLNSSSTLLTEVRLDYLSSVNGTIVIVGQTQLQLLSFPRSQLCRLSLCFSEIPR